MQVEKYLEKYQPVIYKTFKNSLQKEKLSHAYLLSGNPGTPLLEVAKFLAKSILCDDPSPLACDNCITCLRVDDDNYPDFIVFDGSKSSIKKEEVASVEEQFEKTAFESKGIMIYVLHLIENMTEQAINSILKFLEEPGKNVYAFLTTNNENSILPTIISRCQVLHLKLVDRNVVIQDAMNEGVAKEDAELLSYFYNDGELIAEILEDEEEKDDYEAAKEATIKFLEALGKDDSRELIYFEQNSLVPLVKTKESARFFLDMLTQAFKDILSIQNGSYPILESYDTMLRELADKLDNVEEILVEILKNRNLINLNVNISLLLDHLVINITRE
ncbi:MAG: hypothetical protein K6F07_03725 [Bacilli bacterium]|nr:hypothetical protein [Bacilli bacterium]